MKIIEKIRGDRKKIILSILVIFILVLGTSFALWQITLRQTGTNTISTECFKLEFSDDNPINLQDTLPITDEDGKKIVPYEFTLKNICNNYANYQVNLEILDNTTITNLDYIKVQYENDEPKILSTYQTVEKTLSNATISYKLETGYLDASEEKTIHLRLWLSEDAPATDEMMNKIFSSKVTVITEFEKNFDREIPIANLDVLRENNKIIVDGSGSTDNQKIKNYYYSINGKDFIKSSESSYTFVDGDIKYGKATTALMNLKEVTVGEVFLKVEDEYGNMSEVVSRDVGDMFFDETTDNNLRYVGLTPKNYVDFNGEKWRIIGVMNNIKNASGDTSSRVKLIRDESIGNYSWDTSVSSVNDGAGVNEWSQSKLRAMLNEGGPYWERRIGYCFNGKYNSNAQCDFTQTGLIDDAKTLIDTVIWNTGSNKYNGDYQIAKVKDFYNFERSNNTGKICTGGAVCTDNVTRTTTWLGSIGIMYPSDYGYATIGGESMNRRSCYEATLYNWNEECYKNDWLSFDGMQWTMTPLAWSTDAQYVFHIYYNCNVGSYNAYQALSVKPVIYLKENVKIISGDGTRENSYKLSLE